MTFKVGVSIPIKFYTGITGSTVTYVLEDESGNLEDSDSLSENGSITGLYEGTFTPDAAGVWTVIITVGTTSLAQSFPVGFGTISDATYGLPALDADLTTIDGRFTIPSQDTSNNSLIGDAAGNKTDTAVTSVGTTKSIMAYSKGLINQATAIKAKTDLIPASPATNTDATTAMTTYDIDHLVKATYGASKPTDGSLLDQVMNKDGGQTFDSATDSLEALQEAIVAVSAAAGTTVNDTVIYIVAEDMSTTEMTDDGSSPVYLSQSNNTLTSEGAAEAAPSWIEDFNLEQTLTMNVVSVFAWLEAQVKVTGSGTALAKWQMSGNGGSNWVDVTDNFSTSSTTFVDFKRLGTLLPFSSIAAGANKFQVRLCTWKSSGTSVQAKVRTNSYVRITTRRS